MFDLMEPAEQPRSDDPAIGLRALRLWPQRWRYRAMLVCGLLLLISGSAIWLGREQIVGNLIDSYLARHGVAAEYRLVEITPTRQVIADLVMGDPAAPDLTARRVVVDIGVGLMGPAVDRVVVDGARLFGSYKGGKLSFGALDPLVFTGSAEPAALPAVNLKLADARARIASDFGVVAAKLDGAGQLDDGFAGTLAITAPGVGRAGCRAEGASLFGALTTAGGEAILNGPLRLSGVACEGVSLARADIGSTITLGKALDSVAGRFAVKAEALAAGGATARRLTGTASAAFSDKGLALDHDLALADFALAQGRAGTLAAKGTWRALQGAERSEWSGSLAARDLALGKALSDGLLAARRSTAGTLAESLLAQLDQSLARALPRASLTAEAIIRFGAEDTRLVIPEARLRSGAGEVIAALSQVNWRLGAGRAGGRRGNFITGGTGLPRLNGRIGQTASGGFALRLAMADYRAADSRIALPRLSVEQDASGAYRFSGLVAASGALPGGRITGLEAPLEGRWSDRGGLLVGTRCADLRFAGLRLAELNLAARALRLCPASGAAAMLRYDDALSLAATTSALDLAGTMGDAPARLTAERAVLRYPGPLAVEGVAVRLGEAEAQTRLDLASLTGTLGSTPEGTFAGGAGGLAGVPFDLADMAGRWRYDDGTLAITEASFRLSDRTTGQPRFEPLAGKGAGLTVKGDTITAAASLHHPASGTKVAAVDLRHDLARVAGRADIRVDNLTFGNALDVEDLTYLAKGVIAFARGSVTGTGMVDWTGDRVTSRGTFGTGGLDFAAAFGPVRGLKGEVVFTDLLALTTAPDQRLTIAAINTGVEVLDGRIRFALTDGTLVTLSDARWPFMGGELVLRPVTLDFGRPSEKRYVFALNGLDAAVFIAEMELTNLGATGVFDGVVPIIFDQNGNGRIENGLLTARPPGGNIAYVGDLSYEDMGAISNYAFRALRSLDYRAMSVVLEGSLTGEIISKFQFDGVRQGAGTSRNFITRRLAQLPILFRVNVKSESFAELSSVVRSMFDVNYLGNPVDKGLLKLDNGRFVPTRPMPAPASDKGARPPAALSPSDISVQPPESEDRP
ncbi:MAG: YdbH domain-containing protein [Porphyrobacter sp.]|nr:YdbH domain-containing protein [Porphyrobacter sp.]